MTDILAILDEAGEAFAQAAERQRQDTARLRTEHAEEAVILDAVLARRRRWAWLLGREYRDGPITSRDLLRVGDCGQPEAFARLYPSAARYLA